MRSQYADQDYYQTFAVGRNASISEIKSSYKKLAFLHHPDKNPDNREQATEDFQFISNAYETLSHPEQRQLYDLTLPKYPTYATKPSPSTNYSMPYVNEMPPHIEPFAKYVGLDPVYVNKCFQDESNDKSLFEGLYTRIFSMREYLHNYTVGKKPAFNLTEVLALEHQEWLNLTSFYDLVKKEQMSISQAKQVPEGQRRGAVNIWNLNFENPNRNKMILEYLGFAPKRSQEQSHPNPGYSYFFATFFGATKSSPMNESNHTQNNKYTSRPRI
ncbi:MAG: DnaJ domain-containing protein [Gammaproteobacteria bacterium]|nr:DnaJ domain-containing protein [Gammaproteobacteria bacterium]